MNIIDCTDTSHFGCPSLDIDIVDSAWHQRISMGLYSVGEFDDRIRSSLVEAYHRPSSVTFHAYLVASKAVW